MREQSPVRPGDLVDGKYRIETILGVGGMGVVVRALHEQLGRPVAMKFLLPDMLRNEGVVQRFEREARATARLQNEHIIDVLDVGRLPSGEPFIVMEFLEGQDLAKYVSERPARLTVDEIIDVMLQICDGVSEAHASGIVHRDLKPQNVFVTTRRDGRRHIKVLDFGISKMAGDVGGALTRTSDMLGSPFYMSPEQLLATRDVGPSGDIWALGVILYELLSGIVPFEGETLAQICMRIIQEPHVPFPLARADVPPWLAAVVDRCLQKNPAQRMPSADALAAALRAREAGSTQQLPSRESIAHAMTAFTPQSGVHAAMQPISGHTPQLAPSAGAQPVTLAASASASPSASGPRPPLPPATAMMAPSAQVPYGASTNVGWGASSQPGTTTVPMTGGKGVYAIGAVAALVLVSVGGFGIHRFMSARDAAAAKVLHDAPPPPVTTTALATATVTATTTAAAPTASHVPTTTAPPPTSATATAAGTTTATATTPTPATKPTSANGSGTKPPTTPTSHPTSPTGSKPQGTEPDFLPSLRK